VKLTIVGCSPAWPNPGGAQSGYLVESEDRGRLLLDCGSGVLARLRIDSAWPRVDAIAITHFHHDHCGDLFAWAVGALYGPGAALEKPELVVPPAGSERLSELAQALGNASNLFERAFTIREFEPDTITSVVGFELLPVPVPHYDTEAYAFRVSDASKTLTYSGDSGPNSRLVEAARGCDLFLCEATAALAESDARGHLTVAEAQEAFNASGARRLLLTHHPIEHPAAAGLELAREGLEIQI
jgi:ribonuclease BN (tRNA processing enzyme)